MPRCDWCNQFADKVQTLPNGRTNLHLCPMCAAEQQLKDPGELKVADLTRQPSFWEKLKGFFKR